MRVSLLSLALVFSTLRPALTAASHPGQCPLSTISRPLSMSAQTNPDPNSADFLQDRVDGPAWRPRTRSRIQVPALVVLVLILVNGGTGQEGDNIRERAVRFRNDPMFGGEFDQLLLLGPVIRMQSYLCSCFICKLSCINRSKGHSPPG